jgi:hypothetical protein
VQNLVHYLMNALLAHSETLLFDLQIQPSTLLIFLSIFQLITFEGFPR